MRLMGMACYLRAAIIDPPSKVTSTCAPSKSTLLILIFMVVEQDLEFLKRLLWVKLKTFWRIQQSNEVMCYFDSYQLLKFY